MVKSKNKMMTSELDKLNEHETSAVLDYISNLLSSRKHKSKDNTHADDLIVSLSDAPENRRARQVFEWERVRRSNVQRTA